MSTDSISRAADWRRVREEGRPGRAGDLRVRVVPRESPELPARLGLRVRATGRARAVTRNRARRRLRAAWRVVAPRGIDAVVHAEGSSADRNFQEIVADLKLALERAGVRSTS